MAFANVWPTPKIRLTSALSIELAVGLLLLAASPRRWAGWLSGRVLPTLWVVLVAGHYLDVTAPGLYGRDFNLYWDSRHLGNVVAMLARAAPVWLVATAGVALVASVAATYLLARLALGHVARAMDRRRPRLVLTAAAAMIVVLFTGQQLSAQFPSTLTFADPVTPTFARQARFVLATLGPSGAAPPLGPSPNLHASLEGLRGADVLLIFLESYGAVTHETPAIAGRLVESRADLGAAVRDTGRDVLSAYVDAPTVGASSWLAHLSLISGVEVRDQYAYTSLMASDRETLITNFARRGYRTVALMPGLRQPWPEGAFYGFDAIYGRDALEYTGPQFGWWSIPDQYALAKLDALERDRTPRAPLFAVFPTSTGHAPFGPVPPYQADWSRMLGSHAYDEAEVERAMAARPDLANLRPSYVRAMSYEYRSLAGYLREHADDDLLLIAIGDHQPPAAVSGRDVTWTVPVHVFGRSGPVLDRLVKAGFQPGLNPRRPPIGAMHELAPLFLDAFGATDGNP
jgi:hypothetical protein